MIMDGHDMQKFSPSLLARRDFIKYATAGAAAVVALPAYASDRIAKVNGKAIKGYDTTAYFHRGAPQKGSPSTTVEWKGATWQFATAADAEKFRSNPEGYSPQFGGFCTRAMSKGIVVNGDPEVWRIYGQHLYLFARPVGRDHFDKGEDAMIAKAKANWKKLK